MTNFYLKSLDIVSNQEKKFGEWLREKRKERQLTIGKLGELSGVSKQYISLLERAEPSLLTNKPSRPNPEIVEKLAKGLGIELDEARIAAGYVAQNAGAYSDSELQEVMNSLKDGLMASGLEDLPPGRAKEDFFADLKAIAQTMLKERIEREKRRA